MAITTSISNACKQGALTAGNNFNVSGGFTHKIALIKVGATGTYDQTFLNVGTPGTGSPTSTNLGTDEVTGTGYTTGGVTLTNGGVTIGSNVAYTTFSAHPTAPSPNSANRVMYCGDFGGTVSVVSGTLTVVMPANASGTALIRFG